MSIVLNVGSLGLPSSPETLFGRDGPLIAEIGIGSGRFIETLSSDHPEWNVLGIDRAPGSVVRTFRRLHHAGSRNVRILKADAMFVVRDVLPRHSLRALILNFPDPWPRRKHHDRRLLQSGLLRCLSSRLEDNGRILLTSDHPEYFQFACTNAAETGLYRVEEGLPPSNVLETKYARKWKDRDVDIFHAAFIKEGEDNDECADRQVELVETMHHAVLEGDLPELTGFEKLSFSFKRGTVIVLDALQPLVGPGYVFLVHVEEAGLHQEIVIEVRKSTSGFVVGVRRFGEPLQTRGVRHAVRCLSEWLADQGMTIVHRKY